MPHICQTCEKPFEVWEASIREPYHYTESGLPNIFLTGIPVYRCEDCDEASADIPDMDGLHDLIAKDLILTPLPMSGRELRFLRKEARLKPKDFSDRLNVDPKTVSNWEVSESLNKQTDLSIRVLIANELWRGDVLAKMLMDLAALAKYGWEGEEDDDPNLEQDVERLAKENTFLGLNQTRHWDLAAAA